MLRCLLLTILFLTPALYAADPPPNPAQALAAKMHGYWRGPACGGNFTFKPDGTYEMEHYSPASHHGSGTWTIEWKQLPPTLVMNCRTSDAKDLVRRWEAKLLTLDDGSFTLDFGADFKAHYRRDEKASDKE